MVTDALKPMFEQEGVSLIPLDAGAKLVVEEAKQGGGRPVEMLVLAEPKLVHDSTGTPLTRGPVQAPTGKGFKRSSAARSIWNPSRFCRPTSSTGTRSCRSR